MKFLSISSPSYSLFSFLFFSPEVKLTKTNFFNDVYEVVKLIPEGRVTSYGAIVYNRNGYSDEKSEVLMASSNAFSRAGPTAAPGIDVHPRIFVVESRSNRAESQQIRKSLRG